MEDFFQKLRAIQKKERGSSSLSRISNDFHDKVIDFIDDLRENIADDPFSEENDILKKSIGVITEIYEKREYKIANTAIMNIHRSYHLFSGKPQFDFLDTNPLNLTSEEEKLYFSIIETLKVHRERISKYIIDENKGSNHEDRKTKGHETSNLNKPTNLQSKASEVKPTGIQSNTPEVFTDNLEQNEILTKLDGIKKAKIIEEKRESVDGQIYRSQIGHNTKSKTEKDINKDVASTSEDLLTGMDNEDHLNSSHDFKNKDSNLIKDDKNLNSAIKDISSEYYFKDQSDQFIVFEDEEEEYFGHSKTHKKGFKINDPVVIEPILFFDSIPSIMGVDSKVYGPFHPQDVATIPIINAEIIIKNKKGRVLKL
ncbi:MAG: hypothetical protein LBC39_02840 [Methanobrevibacter sp.]|nr:hypothetical protein [Candidatus Methanovirga aequatorialis]